MRIVFIITLLLFAISGFAQEHHCQVSHSDTGVSPTTDVEANPTILKFDSGATWMLCWEIDAHSGLVLSNVKYGGPNQPIRTLLAKASLSQLLIHYDEDIAAHQFVTNAGLSEQAELADEIDTCRYGEWIVGHNKQRTCKLFQEKNLLTKTRHHNSISRSEFSLHRTSSVGGYLVTQKWRFSEDGIFTPSVVLSGKVSRFTTRSQYGVKVNESELFAANSTILANWRLNFDVDDTPNNDNIDEISFVDNKNSDGKHYKTVTPITTESFRSVANREFRGWRISDANTSSGKLGESSATRIGYYIDPQPSGFQYLSNNHSWTKFDFAVTNYKQCEQLASSNNSVFSDCNSNLDQFNNGEELTNPVVWFSLTRRLTPQSQNFPFIQPIELAFPIIPFDWSASSSFDDLIMIETEQ